MSAHIKNLQFLTDVVTAAGLLSHGKTDKGLAKRISDGAFEMHAALQTPQGEPDARAEFERQHEGRNLKRHRMRGTYLSAPIAALWNQHIRTIKWLGAQQGGCATEKNQIKSEGKAA